MSFPLALTSALTGASPAQLHGWKRSGVLVPEGNADRPLLYSFRDLVALRAIVYLRAQTSNQRIVRAMHTLRHEYDLTDHPSQYTFATDGRSVEVLIGDEALELVEGKGQRALIPLTQVFRPFTNLQGKEVIDFEHPRPHLAVVPGRMGGWPTIEDTRVPYDVVADLVRDGDLTTDLLPAFYPTVSAEAAADALSFDLQVRQSGGQAA
ncbi:DUF433 domain-containing protein [Micrococcus luteus]|uniref:Uncharacterized protein (DUF433 family)/DNA-binding transcriptional MerR regulator n=2 Tax=Micrococcus TaxID=1269 RepID=A0ABR6CY15_9MICC|nr:MULTISPECIES: DUF433 domain-containing protein [Micrococcus]TFI15629.1 DUF433 domain-containing protein [Thiopseudomonas sp. 4R-3cl]MBA9058736.1 uncharacterized protein (DUF433 family)/DNA-binding transcriptional MerR regulator [Micrococcus yunnanensis]MBU8741884.1 DUF433 domain-containing protein [Micrococcus luteus]MCC0765677.1 DUF433 domain-containing protein [Micrococcus luteus]MCM3551556.1 DUF433 domain-containing protein [Micrococcus luteus]